MTKELKELIRRSRTVKMSRQEREQQRQSFAYGNAHIENRHVTKQMIAREAAKLKLKHG